MPALDPVEPSFATTAPQKVVVETTVAASTASVWGALADNDAWPKWFDPMSSCISTSDPATGVGSTRSVVVGPLEADELFIIWEPEKAWGFTITRTNLPMAKRFLEMVELEAIGTTSSPQTLVRYTGAFEPHLITKLSYPLVKRQVRSAWTKGLAGLDPFLNPT